MSHKAFIFVMLLPLGSTSPYAAEVSRDNRITPEQLGLPQGTKRTSEPFVTRIYKTDASGTILKKQPPNYPFTITRDYTLKEDEDFRTHQGVDFSSRPVPGERPAPLDFQAGVHGVVVKAGDGEWGTITVQLYDGTLVQCLHTLASHVRVGDVVTPDTLLGITGRTGTGVIHLHVQAKDKDGNAISPDLAFQLGQKKLRSPIKPDPTLLDFDPDLYSPVKPKVAGRKVSAVAEPASKWVVEVIGAEGKVDLVLGEFFDYPSASHCAVAWSESHPDDLRLTREREVTPKRQKGPK